MLPQPYGIPGELIVAGKCLASGYLGQKELTDERFIPNPFRRAHSKTSEKMYKSGDLARFLPDGSIECLGRIDTQVMQHLLCSLLTSNNLSCSVVLIPMH